VLGLFGTVDVALSYAPATHTEIGRTAVVRSDLDAILKAQYRVDRGATFVVNGETVQTWIAIGATSEDFPATRSLNHFHSPLKPWASAGGLLGQSSVYWQQNPDQGLGGTWSGPVARQRLFEFLTLPTPAAREGALADTARALGQVMHMVQDAASPAHTREDPHLLHDGYSSYRGAPSEPRCDAPVPLPGVSGRFIDVAVDLDLHADGIRGRRFRSRGSSTATGTRAPCHRIRSGPTLAWPSTPAVAT
jgi:hypothetical protein